MGIGGRPPGGQIGQPRLNRSGRVQAPAVKGDRHVVSAWRVGVPHALEQFLGRDQRLRGHPQRITP
jgi:hypothetical protein